MMTLVILSVLGLLIFFSVKVVKANIYFRRKLNLRAECLSAVERLRQMMPDYDLTLGRLKRNADALHKLDGEYTIHSFISENEIRVLRQRSAEHAAREIHRQLSKPQEAGSVGNDLLPEKREALAWHLEVAGITLEDLMRPPVPENMPKETRPALTDFRPPTRFHNS